MSDETTSADQIPPPQKMFSLLWPGGLAAQAVYCATELGIADLLADGPLDASSIAERTNCDPNSLERLLRALCSLGILIENAPAKFTLTPLGECLQVDHPAGVRPWARMLGAAFIWRPWGELLETVRSGKPAFEAVFNKSFSQHMAQHPEDAERYNTAMNAGAESTIPAVVSAYDFSAFDHIVDLGGGQGSLLRGILQAYSAPRGTLFDLPEVVSGSDLLQSDVAGRCDIIGGSFFDSVPDGADAYLLKSILHGFSDADAVRILRNVRQAIRDDGKLLVVDLVLKADNAPDPQKAFMDLMMLSLVDGHERTEEQFVTLFTEAGFGLSRIVPTERGSSIVEAIPQ